MTFNSSSKSFLVPFVKFLTTLVLQVSLSPMFVIEQNWTVYSIICPWLKLFVNTDVLLHQISEEGTIKNGVPLVEENQPLELHAVYP